MKAPWGDAPLNQTLIQAWLAGQQQADAPGAPSAPGSDAPDPGDQGKTDFQRLLDDGAKRQNAAADDGEDMAKSFGFPVFKPEP
ncbi:hypothetical protein D3C75_1010490 [compost metagenome]